MATIEHRYLRSALEFAVLIAAEGQKRRPPIHFPDELKPFLGRLRLTNADLGRVRRSIEADSGFRHAISAGAVPELVDDVGRLWLAGRSGWQDEAAELIAERVDEAAEDDLRRDLKRAEKRRLAAERTAARVHLDVMQRDATISQQQRELDELRAEVAKAEDALAEVRAELVDTRNEARHARDREVAAIERAESAAAVQRVATVEPRDDVERGVDRELAMSAQRRLAEAADASREFTAHIESMLEPDEAPGPSGSPGRSQRRSLPLPGGMISTSAEAARHLVRQRTPILADGYNVAKLAWPDRTLEQQRDALIARCENLARRSSAQITIVFDGDSITGAHAVGRRLVRVVYSSAGTTADDVIRAELDALPEEDAVVVVTNDREIVDDVKARGANVIPSNAFIAVL